MKKLVFSSLNYDRVYQVKSFVRPKETILAQDYRCFCGGKGFNLATAMARAGESVSFAGLTGDDGEELIRSLKAEGVDVSLMRKTDSPTGHAVIQVDNDKQNCIIVAGGANRKIGPAYIDEVLREFGEGDLLVLHNEISCVPYLIKAAAARKMEIAFNASPVTADLRDYPLACVRYLFVNEVEGAVLAGTDREEEILEVLHGRFPQMQIILTAGERGSYVMDERGRRYRGGVFPQDAVDTTAAGDTFAGYYLTEYLRTGSIECALEAAAVASGLSVGRPGASPSIPRREEVLSWLNRGFVRLTGN